MISREVILPLPPSLNGMFANRKTEQQPHLKIMRLAAELSKKKQRGRVKVKSYQAWIKEAGWTLKTQPKWKVSGPVRIEINLPFNCAADIDNMPKGLLDLLVSHNRIDDDRNVVELHVHKTWMEPRECRVVVESRASSNGRMVEAGD